MSLSEKQLNRAAELLEVIVRPGDHEIWAALHEASQLFGYSIYKPQPRRSFYGVRKPQRKA